MRRIHVIICEVDDQTPDTMTELAAFDLPSLDVATLAPETALDELERTTYETGNAILRRTLQARWDLVDAGLAQQYRQGFSPSARRRRARDDQGR